MYRDINSGQAFILKILKIGKSVDVTASSSSASFFLPFLPERHCLPGKWLRFCYNFDIQKGGNLYEGGLISQRTHFFSD